MKSSGSLLSTAAILMAGATLTACGGGSSGSVDAAAPQSIVTGASDATTGTDMTIERARRFASSTSTSPSTSGSTSSPTGSTSDASTSTAPAATTSTPATLTLSNLPASSTTSGTASISYQLNTGNSSYTVACRRDSFTPITCPNPFVLGTATALSAGEHQVDFYINRGTSLDLAKPDATHSWTVADATAPASSSSTKPSTTGTASTSTTPTPASGSSTPTTTASTTTPSTALTTPTTPAGSSTPSTVTALANLPYPVPTDIKGTSSPSVSMTSTITGSDGIVRLAPVADPGGSGQQVYLHRIVRNDGSVSGNSVGTNVRAEKVWIDRDKYMVAGTDYWFAFAFRPKAGEWPAYAGMSDDDFLVMQTHSESNGDTQPPLALFVQTGQQTMRWRSSYSAASQATSPQGVSVLNSQGLPSTEVWHKYIVHMRPGYLASQNPRTEIWMATGSSAYTKIVDSSSVIDYNWNSGSYPRIGFYKWSGTGWSSSYPTIAAYFTSLYMETGTNKYDNAVAALAPLK